jgi:hypothetical protein
LVEGKKTAERNAAEAQGITKVLQAENAALLERLQRVTTEGTNEEIKNIRADNAYLKTNK